MRAANLNGGLGLESNAVVKGHATITPAKEISTYVTPAALDFSNVSGMKAYIATGTSGTNVVMTEVGAVPAETPLVLVAATANVAYSVPVAASATAPTANLLVAGDGVTTMGGSSRYDYVLKDGQFRRATEGTVAKGKAYLHLNSASSASELELDFSSVTGIGATLVNSEKVNSEVYDLQGRKVTNPTKGLYIVNGKIANIK